MQSALCPLLDLSIVAGVTSIVNPAKDAEILPFSISAQNFANLATKSANDPKDKGSVFGTPSATSDGPIKKDSSLASIRQGDLSIVYGIGTHTITSGTTTQAVAEVALISRVYQHFNLFAETKFGRIAATLRPDNEGFSAFLYYCKPYVVHGSWAN
ncbi:24abfc7d-42dd-4fdd-ad26-39f35ec40339 [Thermothielavioides terrestris]|uniref:24abfc7d-42dd-4fdd-ad26-39f35ec40339 n=1 Tax=Thermothielavioides terrestris TaxID=2587410 RepID=A0A446BXJ8_9PEZI|nr:24abfc7d-42dd-4fdd-ad26-39f35ec40339 [Thermothielavioides terrestris]